ncbi:unnamed protein product, partial [Onchocerca ochengi]
MVSEDDIVSRQTSLTSISTSMDGYDIALVERLFGHLPSNSIPHCDIIQNEKQQQIEIEYPCHRLTISKNKAKPIDDDNLIAFQFEKFAAAYFQIQNNAHYTRKALRISLLPHNSDLDCTAALAIWSVIQRFMGDASEPRSTSPPAKNFEN